MRQNPLAILYFNPLWIARTAITVVTVDCLRGRYEFDAVKIAHDFGKSMNTPVDRGQVEGAAVQGLGWMTMEEKSIDS